MPRPGGLVVSVSDSWPGGYEFHIRLRPTDLHDMNLDVKVALKPNTINQSVDL